MLQSFRLKRNDVMALHLNDNKKLILPKNDTKSKDIFSISTTYRSAAQKINPNIKLLIFSNPIFDYRIMLLITNLICYLSRAGVCFNSLRSYEDS